MHPGSQGDGICSELDTPADLADFDPVTTNQWSVDQWPPRRISHFSK